MVASRFIRRTDCYSTIDMRFLVWASSMQTDFRLSLLKAQATPMIGQHQISHLKWLTVPPTIIEDLENGNSSLTCVTQNVPTYTHLAETETDAYETAELRTSRDMGVVVCICSSFCTGHNHFPSI